jgi:hypothetical protein
LQPHTATGQGSRALSNHKFQTRARQKVKVPSRRRLPQIHSRSQPQDIPKILISQICLEQIYALSAFALVLPLSLYWTELIRTREPDQPLEPCGSFLRPISPLSLQTPFSSSPSLFLAPVLVLISTRSLILRIFSLESTRQRSISGNNGPRRKWRSGRQSHKL